MLEDRILFVDAEALVLDKPTGLPVDPPRNGGLSLANYLEELKLGFKTAPVAMHRLDTDTSGCLLFARNARARAAFQQAFEARQVRKEYLAVLEGMPLATEGKINLSLGKVSSKEEGWRMVPDSKGKSAITRWVLIGAKDGKALVQFVPETGRTHQIRVHAAHGLNAPICGDPVYGAGTGEPMRLHAHRLVMPRKGKPAIDVTAPLPDSFADFADLLEKSRAA